MARVVFWLDTGRIWQSISNHEMTGLKPELALVTRAVTLEHGNLAAESQGGSTRGL
jgi:hypothetical protein